MACGLTRSLAQKALFYGKCLSSSSTGNRLLNTTSLCLGKLQPTDDEFYTKTTISLLSKETSDVPFISNYSIQGFTISGDKVYGPVAILPRSLLSWNIAGLHDINEDSLSLFHLIEPKIEILVIGTGATLQKLSPELHRFMRLKGIALEVQETSHACATFNYLARESRVVAAGLLPPEQVKR
ncbi:NADH dehydrogenase [ubiquinone] 1 alpha subcomplex assembly factor 3 [Strongylocentrotus purpuratus]|uniref:NADH dehydrogenase [ubiquinone] 1 alpha subcomplex assembly factor 3 n=1 Tax=Strongylocentrotus purpuratus TaxID=7668 RepID=A0A7M7GPW2_STRPU|nr:NADH dehydrogenase [ubiquinone] 1 alpha subcomplex assembly factor 3 [Strongylocentrotus purpuratus]|eukprot:XP_003726684.2 PREDICTED: NADH dehydrogenase [ubiquinone] 1 alpha subcomplex assembly factor 3 [Strongylocentrotus purpuratus]